ncbi:MAG: hypothetical protein ACLQK4_10240 [Acidimicrobiales bacterium]|jgi:hypothetical protein
MPRKSRVRRSMMAGAAGASIAVGLAGCSGGASGGQASAATKALKSFTASKSNVAIFLSDTLEETGHDLSVYSGTGTLDRADGSWSVTVLPFKVTNPSYAEKVLDAGGAVYMDTASLQYVMPKASWITLAGSLTTLQDTVLLPLGVTPLMAAEIAAASGIDYHKTKVTSILGASDQGFSATITASAARKALASDGTPIAYQRVAEALFDGHELTLSVFLSKSGQLGAFGYNCAGATSSYHVGALYYTITQPPGPAPSAPTSGVVSLRAFNAALLAYDKSHGKVAGK